MHINLTKSEIDSLEVTDKVGLSFDTYTIIGAFPKIKYKNRMYVIKCSKCAEDPYLFGGGLFVASYSNSCRGKICGCGKGFSYTEDLQYKRVKRIVEKFDFKFLGFEGEYLGIKTKCKVECNSHGPHSNMTVNNLILYGKPSCMLCVSRDMRARAGSVESKIEAMMATGRFHPSTTFYKSDKRGAVSWNRWYMICGECGDTAEASLASLLKGCRPCSCTKFRPTQGYLNLVYKDNIPTALKFGISSSSFNRIYSQNKRNILKSKQFNVFQFDSKENCILAEAKIKSLLDRSFLDKELFKDGYTETVEIKYLIEIVRIYKKYGGTALINFIDETYTDTCVAYVENIMGIQDNLYFNTKI